MDIGKKIIVGGLSLFTIMFLLGLGGAGGYFLGRYEGRTKTIEEIKEIARTIENKGLIYPLEDYGGALDFARNLRRVSHIIETSDSTSKEEYIKNLEYNLIN